MTSYLNNGYRIFPYDARVEKWAQAAFGTMQPLAQDPDIRRANLRHGDTWFVGVDALPNDATGRVAGIPLTGAWQADVADMPLHRAQVSIIYNGYPKRDQDESLPNHQFRIKRRAAHVDGLLPIGPEKRRFAREFHAYILGIPLTDVVASPTVVWQGSHRIMQAALRDAIGRADPTTVDLTDAYKAARAHVFDVCKMVPLHLEIGEAFLLHPFLVHGRDVWDPRFKDAAPDGRMTAFFRPDLKDPNAWLAIPS